MDFDPRALEVIARLEAAGHKAVLVGGCVRDGLLSITPHDYDVATSALPLQVEQACQDLPCIKTGLKHGTVTVRCQGLSVEVTTFRREGRYSDHRRPDRVEFTLQLNQDLARRDFTINAMAWGREGLVDLFHGQEDLCAGVVRCVGEADQRFEEDALRLLRGLRLAGQLNFSIHPETAQAILRHIPQLSHVAWERISTEFVRLLCSPGAGRILLAFPQAVAQIIPELGPCIGFAQHNLHHCYDVYTHSVKAMEQVPPTPALRLAALLHDVGKPLTFTMDPDGVGHFYGHSKQSVFLAAQAVKRLRLDKTTQSRVLTLVQRHDLPVEASRRWVGRWLARLGAENFFDLLALKRADGMACAPQWRGHDLLDQIDTLARALLDQGVCLTVKDLAVNGQDAMAAGLSGPSVGIALRALLQQVTQGELDNQRDTLLQALSTGIKT